MSQATDQECGRRVPRMDRGAARIAVVLGVYLALASAHCTFPEYNYGAGGTPGGGTPGGGTPGGGMPGGGMPGGGMPGGGTPDGGTPDGGTPDGGTGGAGGAAATSGGGSGATQSGGGTAAALGGGGTAAGLGGADDALGGAPECAPEQWPVEHCAGGCLRRYADHCYDGETSGDEVDVDCGGSCQRCTRETCTRNDDCLSGQCVSNAAGVRTCFAPLTIAYTAHELSPDVGSIAWSVTLFNQQSEGGAAYALKDLKLRYYFERRGIVEPLLVRATQSNLRLANGQSRALKQTLWSVQRVESGPDSVYDAYVEVGFGDTVQFLPGDGVELYQQMVTGDPATSSFDQGANYSFTEQSNASWLHLTVFYKGKLVWGLEPRPVDPRACFVRGVNLNGPALSIAGNAWQGAQDAVITTTGAAVSQAGALFPAVSGTTATLLQTATHLEGGDTLNLPTNNGIYLVYLHATSSSTNDAKPSTFTVQGTASELSSKFRSQAVDGGQVWARLGPFRVDVKTGKVTIGVTTGAINLAGMELWYPE